MCAYVIESKAALLSSRKRCPSRLVRWDSSIKTASGSKESYVDVPGKTDVFVPFRIDFLTSTFVMR
jgi:hypothetical protein